MADPSNHRAVDPDWRKVLAKELCEQHQCPKPLALRIATDSFDEPGDAAPVLGT